MNPAQIKCLAVFAVFAVIGFGPVSPGCLIGMAVVAMRPRWFWALVTDMYADLPEPLPDCPAKTEGQTKETRIKCFLCLLGLFILDIAPVPVTPVIASGIILLRPTAFYRVVSGVYGGN
ncbi:MAG: hypothetical protein WAW36_10790 [Methylovulum miyakonense]|uniref:hypothetical protein n=1 Tax=Methylovulum miyakonense TaxID=645578 RepID=UPI003BB63B9A